MTTTVNTAGTDWEAAGDALIQDGITAAPEIFEKEADYLREAYLMGTAAPQVPAHGIVPVSPDRGAATGSANWKYISLADPTLAQLVLHPGLLGIIQRYYGGQPYLRRMPYVKETTIAPHHAADISTVYHIDQGKHFVSIMMLLSDLTERDSHMRFLKGTHRIEQADFRLKPTDPRNSEVDAALENQYPLFKLVGKKGTMFVYDNGNGIHKGNMIVGTTRHVMQATYSRGDHAIKATDRDLMANAVRESFVDAPALIRTAITQIV